jgi:hypothetical protein
MGCLWRVGLVERNAASRRIRIHALPHDGATADDDIVVKTEGRQSENERVTNANYTGSEHRLLGALVGRIA